MTFEETLFRDMFLYGFKHLKSSLLTRPSIVKRFEVRVKTAK